MSTYPPEWSGQFVDIPFVDRGRSLDGADCYGLCYIVYKIRWGIEIPKHTDEYESVSEWQNLMRLVHKYEREEFWVPIEKPREGAIAKLRVRGRPIHFGLVVSSDWMLHTDEDVYSQHERFDNIIWRTPGKILGYSIHRDLLNAT